MKGQQTPNRFRPHKNSGLNLKEQYRLSIMIGLVFSLSVTVSLFRLNWQSGGSTVDLLLTQQETVQMEEIKQTEQVKKPPPPPRPPVPVAVPDDTVLEDDLLDLDATLDLDEAIAELPPPPPPSVYDASADEAEIFVVVEQMPEIIGGPRKVYEYLRYPEIARQAGMEGLVVIQVVVVETGDPTSPVVARSAGEVLDQAAVDAVMRLKFVPGRQRGRAVKVKLAIPIRFRLRDTPTT